MSVPIRTTSHIADDALTSLRGCHELLRQLESTMKLIKASSGEHSDIAKVLAMAAYLAMDQANVMDCQIEEWQDELDTILATQNAELEIVSRAAEVSA
ncbi:hypothetical protein [Pseudomonas sp.]|uniref:hypothetical protein n=1 Tax=Pseudomonas sp. TaxID=306 RepID=UPI003FD7EB8C